MLLLGKRLASVVVTLALVWGATPLNVRGDLSARRSADALTSDRPAGAAEIGTGRVSPRLFASARRSRVDRREPATAEACGGCLSVEAWSRVVRGVSAVGAFLVACARSERGPPNITLS